MSNDIARKPNRVSIPLLVLRSTIAGLSGAMVGALAFGWGIYFASYSDRVMPFYPVGALAGGATGAIYAVLFVWSAANPKRTLARPFIAASLGTTVLWAAMSIPVLGMEMNSRAIAAAIWLSGTSLLFFVLARRVQ